MENFENENVMYEENNVEVVSDEQIEIRDEEVSDEEESSDVLGKAALLAIGAVGGAVIHHFATKRKNKQKDEPAEEKKGIKNPIKALKEKNKQKKIEDARKLLAEVESEEEPVKVEVVVEEKE
jgi:hypothetical protein